MIWEEKAEEDQQAVGVGFFVADNVAFTAAHNLKALRRGSKVVGRYGKPFENVRLQFKLLAYDKEADYAQLVLQSVSPSDFRHTYLPLRSELPRITTRCHLLTYSLGIRADMLPLDQSYSMGIFPAAITREHPRHFLFNSTAWCGDSGAALILADGMVVGMHLESVNHYREFHRQQEADIDARLNDVEESILALTAGSANGFIGLKASVLSALL